MGELEPDEGSVKWGQTVTTSYLPKDNSEYFDGHTCLLYTSRCV